MGCDVHNVAESNHPYYFNPRTPVGCDRLNADLYENRTIISIHAPQWGATCQRLYRLAAHIDFNPRTPVGCDCPARPHHGRAYNFNPRTPVGCDSTRPAGNAPCSHFNPRTPVGCDATRSPKHAKTCGFQSTHPSGVRQYGHRKRGLALDFNPRTPVGCDRCSR